MDSDELLDAFLIQQLHHQPITHIESANLDAISSWLNLDDDYTPAIPSELQDLENHLLHFDTDDSHSLCSIPGPDSSLFLPHDLYNLNSSDAIFNGPSTTCQQPVSDEYNSFICEPELCFVTPSVSPETTTIANHNHASTSQMLTPAPLALTEENEMKYEVGNGADDDDKDEDGKINCAALNSKNLVSERNRRKRFSQQMLALRALVPNITKMDKRSVLVDAVAYLKSTLEETARLQKVLKEQPPTTRPISNLRESCRDNPAATLRIPPTLASSSTSKSYKTQITEVDIEKMEERRFVVKSTCKSGKGACGDVLRVIESIGFEIAYASLQQLQSEEIVSIIIIRKIDSSQDCFSTTHGNSSPRERPQNQIYRNGFNFHLYFRATKHTLRANKQRRMTEEKLKDIITSVALRLGLTFQNP